MRAYSNLKSVYTDKNSGLVWFGVASVYSICVVKSSKINVCSDIASTTEELAGTLQCGNNVVESCSSICSRVLH
ncbi:Protein of unknown function, partial [Gryllus bimaculatus]